MEKTTTDIDITQSQMDEFVLAMQEPPLQPDEFTVAILAEKTNVSTKTVRYRMEKLIKSGVIQKRKLGIKNVYKPVDGKTWKDAANALVNIKNEE